MKSLAKNMKELEVKAQSEPYYPSLIITEKMLPELKDAKINDTGLLLIKYQVKAISKYGNGDVDISLDLEQGEVVEEKKNEAR